MTTLTRPDSPRRQFNSNYFHLTASAIKTVSSSDRDSCYRAEVVTRIARQQRNYRRLCFARPLCCCCRQQASIKLFISQFSPPSAKLAELQRNPTRLQIEICSDATAAINSLEAAQLITPMNQSCRRTLSSNSLSQFSI